MPVVINNLQTWVIGILAAVATPFLVLAGVYWATAGGDPAQRAYHDPTGGDERARYTAKDLVPRCVVGFIASHFSQLCAPG